MYQKLNIKKSVYNIYDILSQLMSRIVIFKTNLLCFVDVHKRTVAICIPSLKLLSQRISIVYYF